MATNQGIRFVPRAQSWRMCAFASINPAVSQRTLPFMLRVLSGFREVPA